MLAFFYLCAIMKVVFATESSVVPFESHYRTMCDIIARKGEQNEEEKRIGSLQNEKNSIK